MPTDHNQKPSSSEPERRHITALSCDLVDAMGLAAGFDPEELSGVTRIFQDTAITAVRQMGGTIGSVAPEHILAFFGYPEAHEDDAERAVNAGLDAVLKVGQLVSPKGEHLQARVGIATGLALASQNQAIGEPSIMATALCDLAPPTSVVINASTRKLLSGAFHCEQLKQFAPANASQPVSAWRVTARRAVASRFKAQHSKKIPRLVGRDQELHRLLELWHRTKRSDGQVALLNGEPGIGKSHLCEFFLQRCKEAHATFRYQCSPHHLNSPFYPVITQLEHTMGFQQTDTPELKLTKLEVALRESVEATQEEIFWYAKLLSIATPESQLSANLSPQRQKDLTIAAVGRHMQRLADKQPLIIVVADAHWADSSTLELVDHLIPRVKTIPVFFLIEFRPEFVLPWSGEPHVTMLRLDRMNFEHSIAIINEVTGKSTLPPEIQEQIVNKADGVPLFIEELTKSVQESELVREVGGKYVMASLSSSTAIPTSLIDSLTARFDRLGAVKGVAQIGAVIGRAFSRDLLAAVTAESADTLGASLGRLVSSELISVSGTLPDATYLFKHALVRDAAYATLSLAKRQRLHSRIADVLEKSFPSTVQRQPELVALHLAQAGRTARAIHYLQEAGRRAIEHSANVEAIGHLTRALELLRLTPDGPERERSRFVLELTLSQAMIAHYGYAARATRETLMRARTLINHSKEIPDTFAVLYGVWASHYVAGEVAKQRSVAAEFLMEAKRTGDRAIQCMAHRIAGTTHVTIGEFATGLHHLQRARALYDREHHASYRHQYGQDIGAATLCYLSWALWHLGCIDQASEAADEAMRLAEELSHPHTLAYTICHARGFMDLFRRRHESLHAHADLVGVICSENRFSHWANCGTVLDGWAAVCAGELDRGIKLLQQGIVQWQKGGAKLWVALFLKLEAEANARAGHVESGLKLIDQAIAACEKTGERWALAEVLRVKASLLLKGRGGGDAAESLLLRSLNIARHQQARCWDLRASCDLSRLWQRRRRNREALEVLQSAYDQFAEGFETEDLHLAEELLQELRGDLGGSKECARRTIQRRPNRAIGSIL